jgi:hypothetical protein
MGVHSKGFGWFLDKDNVDGGMSRGDIEESDERDWFLLGVKG